MQNALSFLLNTLFDIYISVVLLRFLLQWVRADFYNPFSQLIVKLTNPILVPLRKVIPGYKGIDWSSLLLGFALILIKASLLSLIGFGAFPPVIALLIYAVLELIVSILYIFWISIIIQAILSWIPQMHHHPITGILQQLTRPILRPIQRIIPPMGGFDLSPLVALIGLQFLIIALGG